MISKQCTFCKIVREEAPANILYRDEEVLAFEDTNPQAPFHILVVPKKHIPNLLKLSPGEMKLIGKIYQVVNEIAREKGLEKGFRVVVNCGSLAGQSVDHLHFHLLGKRRFCWPPG